MMAKGRAEVSHGPDAADYVSYTPSAREARNRILGTILLPARTKATFGKDTDEMLRQRLTFAEANEQFDLMDEQKALHDAWKTGVELLSRGQNTALRQVVV